MTHKDELVDLLTRMGVFHVVAEGAVEDIVGIPAHVYGEEAANYKNAGYRGFSADLSFDKDGNLKEFGMWE